MRRQDDQPDGINTPIGSKTMSETIEHAREGIEEAHHAPALHGDATARRIAVLIAVLAAALALAEMGEKGAQNEYLTHHVAVADEWAFFQAKNVRATVLAAEAGVLANLPNAAEAGPQAEIKRAQESEARMRDEPNGDGTKQIAERAKAQETARDEAFRRYHEFELVVGALQIAIVLASVAVVTRITALALGAGAMGAIAAAYALFVAV
jgi:hypothetical protein